MKRVFITVLVLFVVGYSEPSIENNDIDYFNHYGLLTEEEIDSINNLFILEHQYSPPWCLGFTFTVESESELENVLLQIAVGSDTLKWITLLDTVLCNGVYQYRLNDVENPFESGMYFYRTEIGDTSIVQKMIIMR